MRRYGLKRHAGFALTFLLLTGACVAIGADVAEETAKRYLELSRAAEANGDFGTAAEMLDRARRGAAPERWRDCTRRMMLLALRQGNAGEAKRLLSEFQQRYPEQAAECRGVTGRIAFAEGKYDEAVELLTAAAADASLPHEDAVAAWRTVVRAQLAQHRYAAAETAAAKLEETAGTEEERFWGRSRRIFARIMGEDPASAEALFREKTATKEEQRILEELELLYWIRTGDFERFDKAYSRVTSGVSSDEPDMLLFLVNRAAGEYLQQRKRAHEGEEYFRRAIAFAPDEALRRRTMAQLIDCRIAAENYAGAAASIDRYLEFYPDDPKAPELRINAARLLAKAGRTGEAVTVLYGLLNDSRMARGDRFDAGREAVEIAAAGGDIKLEQEALGRLESFARDAAEKAATAMLYGHYEYRAGRFDAAAARFAAAAAAGGETGETARFWQLQSLVKAGRYEAAIPVADSLREAKSEEFRGAAAFYRAEALEHTGDTAGAVDAYLAFREAFPNAVFRPSAGYRAASLLSGAGAYDRSLQLFSAFAEEYPEHDLAPAALLAMQKAAFLNGDEAAMTQAVARLRERYPASSCTAAALFRMVDYFRTAGHAAAALNTLSDIENISGGDEARLSQCLYDRAVILTEDDPAAADRLLEELAKKYPQSEVLPDAMLLRGNLCSDRGDYAAAAVSYGAAAELRPEGLFGEICRGRRGDSLMNEGERTGSEGALTEAAAIFAQLAESADPSIWGAAVFKQGRVLELKGDLREALARYKELLYRAAAAAEKGEAFDRLWCSRALYRAVRLDNGRRTVAAARDGLQLIALGRALKLATDAREYSQLEDDLRSRINF